MAISIVPHVMNHIEPDALLSKLLVSGDMRHYKIKGMQVLTRSTIEPVQERNSRDAGGRFALTSIHECARLVLDLVESEFDCVLHSAQGVKLRDSKSFINVLRHETPLIHANKNKPQALVFEYSLHISESDRFSSFSLEFQFQFWAATIDIN